MFLNAQTMVYDKVIKPYNQGPSSRLWKIQYLKFGN